MAKTTKPFVVHDFTAGDQKKNINDYLQVVKEQRAAARQALETAPETNPAPTVPSADDSAMAASDEHLAQAGALETPETVADSPNEETAEGVPLTDELPGEESLPSGLTSPAPAEEETREMYKNLYKTDASASPLPEPGAAEQVTESGPTRTLPNGVVDTNKAAGTGGKRSAVAGISPEISLVNYLKRLPAYYDSFASQKGEIKVRLAPELVTTLRIVLESIDQTDQPKFMFDNLINGLVKEMLIKHAREIALLAQSHIQREKQRSDQQLNFLKGLLND